MKLLEFPQTEEMIVRLQMQIIKNPKQALKDYLEHKAFLRRKGIEDAD